MSLSLSTKPATLNGESVEEFMFFASATPPDFTPRMNAGSRLACRNDPS